MNINKIRTISTSDYCGVSIYEDGLKAAAEANFIAPDWWISRVVVNPPNRRNEGIGGKLLEHLKEVIKKRGGETLLVTPGGYGEETERQVRFYRSHGFNNSCDSYGVLLESKL